MQFRHKSVTTALEASLKAADHLEIKHAALVAQARQLAKQVDLLAKGRVIDGKLDNVSEALFLKVLDSLGLTVPKPELKRGPKAAEAPTPEPEQKPQRGSATILSLAERAAAKQAR